jgi:hypothetical protein
VYVGYVSGSNTILNGLGLWVKGYPRIGSGFAPKRGKMEMQLVFISPHPGALKKTFRQLPLSHWERGGGAADGVRVGDGIIQRV